MVKKGENVDSKKRGFSIGRLYHVAPGCGESYYLRTLIIVVKGPTSYEDIRTIDGVIHPSFKDACYSMGLLDDDKEYIDEITEASFLGSTFYLRKLFAMSLMFDSLSRPKYVWDNTWKLLFEDVLNRQRSLLQMPGNV